MKNIIKKTFYITFASVLLTPTGLLVQASELSNQLVQPIGFKEFKDIVLAILKVVTQVGTILIVLAIIYAGFLFVTAQGKDEQIQKAKSTFFWVVIGAIIILGAEVLANVICSTAAQIDPKLTGIC